MIYEWLVKWLSHSAHAMQMTLLTLRYVFYRFLASDTHPRTLCQRTGPQTRSLSRLKSGPRGLFPLCEGPLPTLSPEFRLGRTTPRVDAAAGG